MGSTVDIVPAVPISARQPSTDDLDAWLLRVRDQRVTYREVGATAASELPAGYRHDRYSVSLGEGDTAFNHGREALMTWQAHRHVGATLVPDNPEIAVGNDVIMALRVGLLSVVLPCRIVRVADNESRYGFGYGTLPGHPERGEEAFHVVRNSDGNVDFEVVAFSRPADRLMRLTSPLARLIQTRITRGYLQGVRLYVEAAR
jgi:uncharacterized protein (UPF0548 family)